MKKNYSALVVKLIIGIAIVAGIWWIVKCQCVNLRALAPAAIRNYINLFGRLAILAYIIAYVLNTVSILPPIATLSLAAGLAFGEVWGAVYLMIGAIIGTSATFMISRYFGRDLVKKILKGKFKELDEKLAKNGFATVLFFRVIPLVPYEVLNYAGGLSKIKFKDYFFGTFLGLIPGVIIAAFLGGSVGIIKGMADIFSAKLLIVIGLMVTVISVPVIYRKIRKRRLYFKCRECGLFYKEAAWAEKCEKWCAENKSCNIEIIRHAIKNEGDKSNRGERGI